MRTRGYTITSKAKIKVFGKKFLHSAADHFEAAQFEKKSKRLVF